MTVPLAESSPAITDWPRAIRLTEVSPRDGLQNEKQPVPTAVKLAFIESLLAAGAREIEVTAFVSPKWVPQLADAADLTRQLKRKPGVRYHALVPNIQGLETALSTDLLDVLSVFTAASETFAHKNINASIAESIERFRPVVTAAHQAHKQVRGYISCVVACPFEGPIAPAAVADVIRQLLDLGVDEIDLGETIGVAAPTDIARLYEGIEPVMAPAQTTLHLHDTRGTALACLIRALELGVTSFDASAGGLGGCPYAPGAAGNIATEDVVYCLERMNIRTGIDLKKLVSASRIIEQNLGRRLASRTYQAQSSTH